VSVRVPDEGLCLIYAADAEQEFSVWRSANRKITNYQKAYDNHTKMNIIRDCNVGYTQSPFIISLQQTSIINILLFGYFTVLYQELFLCTIEM
jgi:hypothetical protein